MDRQSWRRQPHEFVGRLDRPCDKCYLPDRVPIHRREAESTVIPIIERDEPQAFEELTREVDIRVDALRRGRTDWGCGGSHRGNYSPAQIEAGAPNCPRHLHHHHDPFCREPSPLELRLAGVTKPEQGWGSRA